MVIGATNRPQEIDEAARRRLLKRLYIPLPDTKARAAIIRHLTSKHTNALTEEDIQWICEKTDGYSGSDLNGLCKDAALGPMRSINIMEITSDSDVPPITRSHFESSLSQIRASVSSKDLEFYLDWNEKFGSLSI